MTHNIWIYILVSALVSYSIRVIPLTLIRKPITNRFLRSFLHYVPYATLAVMTFPAMIYATDSLYTGIAALLAGILLAWYNKPLLSIAITCCLVVLVLQLIL
ncbi:MAG: AzlD domain-containing protein [Solobacterium sp.]|nr:AzlD domain-containing protein [Solobacterium sp.]